MDRCRIWLLALACLATGVALAAERERPNIVFLFSDDLTPQAISAYHRGLELPATPGFDRLAREGMLFENSFCANSICTPSRATVMTGLHSHRNGIVNLAGVLDPDRPTWPKALHASGYTTAIFGKWHLKTKPTGFDKWGLLSGQGDYYNPEIFDGDGGRRIEGHSTEIITDLALDWLERRDPSKPFALLVQHKAPHRNWLPGPKELALFRDTVFPEPETLFDEYETRVAASAHKMGIDQHMRLDSDLMVLEDESSRVLGRLTPAQKETFLAAFREENQAFLANPPTGKALVRWKYQRYLRNYLRCVAGVDRNVTRVLEKLDAMGLAKNTLVVYSSDQGFYLGEHGWFDKRWAYEESMRMPLIVRWPGHVKPGTRAQAMVQNIDYAPTLLDAAGLKPDWELHGLSLLPILTGEGATPSGWRDTLYYRYSDGGHGVASHSAIRTRDWKLLFFDRPRNEAEEANRWELFDLRADPQEMRNLSKDPAHAERLQEMQARFEKTRAAYGDTDEKIWTRPRPQRFEPDRYIRRPR